MWIAALVAILFIGSAVFVTLVWIRRRRFTKERFAFAALSSFVFMTGVLVTSIASSSMPWDLVESIIGNWSGNQPAGQDALPIEYLFLLSVYALFILAVLSLFKNWDGLNSVSQFEAEQRIQEMSLLSEGSKEFRRILFRREPLPIYKPERYRLTLDIASSSEYVPWRDRAFDLVQLRWSHYVFRRETGWLDAETCWTGRNMNTSATVLLWCISKSLTDSTLQDLIRRSDRIMIDSGESSLEVIFAVEEGDLESTESLIRSSKGLELRLETEATMLDGLVDWTDYRNYIRKRMCETRLQDSDLTVSDVFVEPHISGVGQKDDKSYRLEQYLNVWLEERSQRHVAILGDYGQGKSTAALAFAYSQLSREGAERIPILLELRGRSPRNMKPLELVATWSATYNINPQALMYLHRAGKIGSDI